MPTFNEAVRIEREGPGEVLLELATERSWLVRQQRSGADTALELVSLGGGGNKDLIISTTGRVGVGTASPTGKLHVFGGHLHVSNDGDGAVLLALDSERGWVFRQRGTGAGTALELAGNSASNNNKDFLINTEGNVGIGTLAPSAKLHVDGSIRVTDDVILDGADCAEDFDIEPDSDCTPGTVMVIGPDGRLRHCSGEYDRRVAGVVSGAGDRRPGIVLGRRADSDAGGRVPLALTGTVVCRADAAAAAIDVGDLLTTSGRSGHAMAATDPARSFGAVIGKALGRLPSGVGTIPVLVGLH